MITESELITILNDEADAVSIEKDALDEIGTSLSKIKTLTGRDFKTETFVIPNPQGGLAIISEIVRFKPNREA